MLDVQIEADTITFGKHLRVCFKRTLRIPDDGKVHKAPPNFGVFPVYRIKDYEQSVSGTRYKSDDAFITMYQREALYIRFDNETWWRPYAVKVSIGGINAISGEPHTTRLRRDPQDYLVCPPQLWLDGINSGDGNVRQFLAMPLGLGYTVEGSLTGVEKTGGLQLTVFAPKAGAFPDAPPQKEETTRPTAFARQQGVGANEMGLGAGSMLKQKILPDPYGFEVWDETNSGEINVHILNSAQFQSITEKEAPPTPVDEETYREHEFPWFPLYGEVLQGDVSPSELLTKAKTVANRDAELKE